MYTKINALAALLLTVVTVQAHGACWGYNSEVCSTETTTKGPYVPAAGPGGGCHYTQDKVRCKGGPNSHGAEIKEHKLYGYKDLGDKCGKADLEHWYWDAFLITPGLISTNYCLINFLTTPYMTGSDPDAEKCGEKVAVGAFEACDPSL
jgi:hypothetical protein